MVYEYTCGRCNSSYYGETERHLKVRSGEHIGISPLSFKKTKPSKEGSIRDHLLQCGNNPSFDEFTILAHGNKKYLLEIKEILLIKCNQPVLNKNISSATLYLFDTVLCHWLVFNVIIVMFIISHGVDFVQKVSSL